MTTVAPVFQSYADMMRETDYARFDQEHRTGGTLGFNQFVSHQDPMEMTDPPNAEVGFVICLAPAGPMECHLGDGWVAQPMDQDIFTMQPARQICQFRTGSAHSILATGVQAARLSVLLDEVGLRGDPFGAFYARNRPLTRVSRLFRRIWSANEAGGAANSLLVDGLFREAIGLLLHATDQARHVAPPPDLDDRRLQRVIDYVEAHIETSLNVGELAGTACVSVFHFGRIFRAATGETPHRYVMRRRVERAKEMLLATELDLTSIALTCGFASHSHLTECFHRHVGAAPGAWRTEVRG